ncbi:MAG: MopE-related protein, partial [Myxococcota bacterium]
MKSLSLCLLAVLAIGCTGDPGDTGGTPGDDLDADGFTAADGDCDDGDALVFPGAEEAWYDGVDQDCDGNDTDRDGDGFAVGDDCDDTVAAVNPDGVEACDGVDNDCDGTADVGATDGFPVYADADGDGFGADGTETTACAVTAGWAEQAGDCDDAQATVYPSAAEICDDYDNDCDGELNEGSPDEVLYYRDADADGYGDAADAVLSCATPAGYTADATDCDDLIAVVHPGADEYCDGTDRDCDGDATNDPVDGLAYHVDADLDGFGDPASALRSCEVVADRILDGTDCDDADTAVNPAAAEVCDGVDNDCSTAADDGLAFWDWYADADADGYGDAAAPVSACAEPEGHVGDATDCDDADAATFPGATEVCDLEDNDCDGAADDGAVDERTYYDDGDSDGYGDADASVSSCGAPSGYVETGDDCDDANSLVNPGAEERCNGLDDDCDATADDAAVDATVWYADLDGDGYGDAGASTASCDDVDGYVLDATDCDDTRAAASPAGTETCNGA